MAQIHPSFPLHAPASLGGYRERDILKMLEKGLDDRFDVFHNVPWSGMQGDQQSFGEYDFVIVSPGGQLLILEIKSGDVIESDVGLTKQYGRQGPKDIGHQMRRMHSSLLQRIDNGDLPQVHGRLCSHCQRFNLFKNGFGAQLLSDAQVVCGLQIQPPLGLAAEIALKAQGCIC